MMIMRRTRKITEGRPGAWEILKPQWSSMLYACYHQMFSPSSAAPLRGHHPLESQVLIPRHDPFFRRPRVCRPS